MIWENYWMKLKKKIEKYDSKSWYYALVGTISLGYGVISTTATTLLRTLAITFGIINIGGGFWYKLSANEYKKLYRDTQKLKKDVNRTYRNILRKNKNLDEQDEYDNKDDEHNK